MLKRASEALHASSVPADAAAEFASLCSAFANLPEREEASAERRARASAQQGRAQAASRAARGRSWRDRTRRRAARSNQFNGTCRKTARASSAFTSCSSGRRIGSRRGAWQPTRSTTGASSTSTISPRCAWRTSTFSRRRTASCFTLAAAGKIDGLRIDHPGRALRSGAVFPAAPAALRAACRHRCRARERKAGAPALLIIEKIAAGHERLPESWAVHGTSGYRFATRGQRRARGPQGGGRNGTRLSRLRAPTRRPIL